MIHSVGPGQKYTTPSEVPWERLLPGDTVRIVGRPEPYRDKILLSQSGTPQAPIRLEGVPGPKGEPAVLDGDGAVAVPSTPYHWPGMEPLAFLLVARRAGQPYASQPAYIEIVGLTIRNANRDASFSSTTRSITHYDRGAAGIYLMQGDHITIRDCVLEKCGNGLFTKPVVKALRVIGCTFRGNGVPGVDRQHHLYAEASDAEYLNLTFESLAPGSLGSCLKDRSGTALIKGCRFVAGPKTSRLIDLVDPQDGFAEITRVPEFGRADLIENTLVVEAGGYPIHYGGDSQTPKAFAMGYRKSKLTLRGNQILIRVDRTASWNTALLKLDTNEQIAELGPGNRIIWEAATPGQHPTEFYLAEQYGQVRVVGDNQISAGWSAFQRKEGQGTLVGENRIRSTAGPQLAWRSARVALPLAAAGLGLVASPLLLRRRKPRKG